MKRPIKKSTSLFLAILMVLLLLPATGYASELDHSAFKFDPAGNVATVSFYYSDGPNTAAGNSIVLNVTGAIGDTINGAKFDVRDDSGVVVPEITATASDRTLAAANEQIQVTINVQRGGNTALIDTETQTGDSASSKPYYLYYGGNQIGEVAPGLSSFTIKKIIQKRRGGCAITAFVIDGYTGTITDSTSTISVRVPYAANITSLVPSFTCSAGATVWVSGTQQFTNANANNFSNTLDYQVIAEDGTMREYAVTVTRGRNTACDITGFSIPGQDTVDIDSTKNPGTIVIHMPSTSTVTSITTVPTIALSEGATISPAANEQKPFSSVPIPYTVTAEDGVTSKVYNVTLGANNPHGSGDAAISSYSLNIGGINYAGVINDSAKTITITLPAGVTATTGIATFTASTGAIARVNGTAQVSGTSSNSFATPQSYVVTAQDGVTTNTYTVTVTPGAAASGSASPTASAGSASPTPTPGANAIAAGYPITNGEGSISVVASGGISAANPTLTTTMLFTGDVYQEMKKAAGNAKILTAYDITLVNPGTLKGPYYITFNVGHANVGRTVTILHRKSERNYETAVATVDGTGRLAIRASSLSPFMLLNGYVVISGAATEINTIPLGATGSSVSGSSGSGGSSLGIPKTGAWDKTGVGLVFMIIAVLLAILVVLYLWMDLRDKDKKNAPPTA